jgi:hypothetical protein
MELRAASLAKTYAALTWLLPGRNSRIGAKN